MQSTILAGYGSSLGSRNIGDDGKRGGAGWRLSGKGAQATSTPNQPATADFARLRPLFHAEARSCAVRLQVGHVDYDRLVGRGLGGQAQHELGKDPFVVPTFPAIVQGFGWPYSRSASHYRTPLRLMKNIPFRTRRSSTRGLPWLFGKKGFRRSIWALLSQKRLLIVQVAVRGLNHAKKLKSIGLERVSVWCPGAGLGA
ncbi:hypothetical protein SAMN04488239_12548 [Ruegeria marina]|uniref:Uncharacterized protein n=1 Tax=Ruegeria marina TaxID=639004 RepID=A0A1G7EHD0_9RHOB|nr:hypothetical protein SAMN04488239_12548 [Ruegeria marina]